MGTSSLRRRAQLLRLRPDLGIENLRGNVDTRLRKLQEGEYDAIILAAAGLTRLGRASAITCPIPAEEMVPAVGQGVLAIEIRADDRALRDLLAPLHHEPTALAVSAERAFLTELEGGCQVPMAAHAVLRGGRLRLDAMIASLDGRTVHAHSMETAAAEADARSMGVQVARVLLGMGGAEILKSIKEGGLP